MTWSLYSKNNEILAPLIFSNGKSQEDIVKEILKKINEGKKVIFVNGACGTGKSAIALNLARKMGKTSIVVPGKNLQRQYKEDYGGKEKNKYLLKNGNKLKINVITGRNNHRCKFLEDSKTNVPKIPKEINSKLHDIFEGIRERLSENKREDVSADNDYLPCKIKISDKNWKKIREYLRKNKDVNIGAIRSIKDVKRIAIASVCPYWSPVFEDKYEFKQSTMVNAVKKSYKGLDNKNFIFYYRRPGCSFYEQFHDYIDSDVIVVNSLKYKLESLLKRKPETEVEIIDECDEFLDSFSNQRSINLGMLQGALMTPGELTENNADILAEIGELIRELKNDERIKDMISSGEITPLKETKVYDLIRLFSKNKELIESFDEESYIYDILETAFIFEDSLDESYVTAEYKEDNLIFRVVTTNLEKRFKELLDNNKVLVLMSGTLHDKRVLNEIFGIKDFEIIDAETGNLGNINVMRIGLEFDCKYSNFASKKFSRERYLKILNECVKKAKKPVLVHITAFKDLPSDLEIKKLFLNHLISKEELITNQENDKKGEDIQKFKKGKINVLFSTKASRGIDFPGEECNSIVFTKYPNPAVNDAFWKILRRTKPEHYWSFYKDKARRDLLQKVYRGLRFKEDKIYVLSPDKRVLDFFDNQNC